MSANVVSFELKEEYKKTSSAPVTEIHAGFSERLNYLIDTSTIDVPKASDGRFGYIADLFDGNKSGVHGWLTKNKAPKESTLFQIVEFFLKHIESGSHILAARVVTWLKYGDNIIPCPFRQDTDASKDKLIPVAAQLIAQITNSESITPDKYDLAAVLEYTVEILFNFQITNIDQVKDAHRLIIKQKLLN